MEFQEKEAKYSMLRKEIRKIKKEVTSLKNLTIMLSIAFVVVLCSVLYVNTIVEIENSYTKISNFLLLIMFAFLLILNFLIKKKKHQMKVIDGKINVLINIE
ncbi:MAG: hypothetical protein JXQ93_07625 [Flavobacteriaceae bacterium]